MSVLRLEPFPFSDTAYRICALSSHSTWSSTLRVSPKGVSVRVFRSNSESRQLIGPEVIGPVRLLKAIRVLSGDSEGHSTPSYTTVAARLARSHSTRYCLPKDESVA